MIRVIESSFFDEALNRNIKLHPVLINSDSYLIINDNAANPTEFTGIRSLADFVINRWTIQEFINAVRLRDPDKRNYTFIVRVNVSPKLFSL